MKTNKNKNVQRTDHHIKRIETIARVSAELFSKKGYAETSMDDVAKASRMAKGGIYYYFHTKEEILDFICSSFMDLKLKELEKAMAGVEDAVEKVRLVVFQSIRYSAENAKAARILFNESRCLSQKHLKMVRMKEGRYNAIVIDVISRFLGQQTSMKTVTALSLIFLGLLDGICFWYDPRSDLGSEELSRMIFELFVGEMRGSLVASPEGRNSLALSS